MSVTTIEVRELLSTENEDGAFIGVYAQGHFADSAFAQAVRLYFQNFDIDLEVKRDYWRARTVADSPGVTEFVQCPTLRPGAFPVTYAYMRTAPRSADFLAGLGQAAEFAELFLTQRGDEEGAQSFRNAFAMWSKGFRP